MKVKHKFTCELPTDPKAKEMGQVCPDDWNNDHEIQGFRYEISLNGLEFTVSPEQHGLSTLGKVIVRNPAGKSVSVVDAIEGLNVHLYSNIPLDGHTLTLEA